jgi:hypothetical protein
MMRMHHANGAKVNVTLADNMGVVLNESVKVKERMNHLFSGLQFENNGAAASTRTQLLPATVPGSDK